MMHEDGLGFDLPEQTRRSTPSSFLLDAIRRREAGRQALSVLTTLLFITGGGLFTFPLLTDVYANQYVQGNAEDEYALISQSVDTFEEYESRVSGQDGVAITKIVIEDIGLQTLVVEGTSPSALRAGAGHYDDTPLPGQLGNVAIAGHRTTYGKPFNRLDELDIGGSIWLITPYGDFRYEIVGDQASPDCSSARLRKDRPNAAACLTAPNDWTVVKGPEDPTARWLTLTTCHPKGSAAERLIIRAVLAEELPPNTYVG
jgi:sortase A